MSSSVAAIARVSFLTWTRETAAQFRLSSRGVVVLAATVVVLCVAFGIGLGVVATGGFPAAPGRNLIGDEVVARVLVGFVFLTGCLVTTVLTMLGPPRSSLTFVLDVLPVGRPSVAAGLQAPVGAMATLLTFSLSGAVVSVLWQIESLALRFSTILVLLLFVVLSVVMALAFFGLFQFVARAALRLPSNYAVAFAGVVTGAAAVGAVLLDVLDRSPVDPAADVSRYLSPSRACATLLARLAGGEFSFPAAVSLGFWFVLAVVVFNVSSRLVAPEANQVTARLLLGWPVPRSPFAARVWCELLQLVRSAQFIVLSSLIVVALAGVVTAAQIGSLRSLAPLFVQGVLAAPFFLGLQSGGLTLPTHWMGRMTIGSAGYWIVPKALGCLGASAVVFLPLVVVASATGLITWADSGSLLVSCLAAWAAAMLGGALVPYSSDQPFSSTVTGLAVAFVYGVCTIGVDLAEAALGTDPSVVPNAVAAVACLAVYVGTARALSDA